VQAQILDSDNKLKHLEFLQLTITRMAANSFILKAWTVTLVSALFALSAKDSNKHYIIIACVPTVMFWLLDGYYLHQEPLFRALYDNVRTRDAVAIDFSLSTAGLNNWRTSWPCSTASITLVIFYGSVCALLFAVVKLIH